MSELGYHIEMKLEDGRVIATTTAERRVLAQVVLDKGRDCGLLAARAPDSHLHAVAACSRPAAGVFASRVSKSLRYRLGLPVRFSEPYIKPIRDQRYLYAASRYVFRQDERHGVDVDPWGEASNLPDLLGLRLVGRYTAGNVRRLVPRIRPEELAARIGVTIDQLREGTVSPGAMEHLADAAAAAMALPDLSGRSTECVEARTAAVALVSRVLPNARVAALLTTTERTVHRLQGRPANPALVEAVARQLRLRSAAAAPPIGTDASPVVSLCA